MELDYLKKDCIVVDIETCSVYGDGRDVDIRSNFEDYVDLAQVKWVGLYSYRTRKEYYLNVSKDREQIFKLLDSHDVMIGFNHEEFDYPILKNNGLVDPQKWYRHVDCMKILGSSTFKDKNGYKYKGRGNLMGYKFKKNSLQCIAETMGLEFQKSTIDYKIFKNDTWTESEQKEIITYLRDDIMSNRGMFERLWDYWIPFTSMLDEKSIKDLSWIRSSIASLVYKSVCHSIGTEPEYSDHASDVEEMGGRVIEPKYEEARKVWYIDFSSLYPHIFCMFNLFDEVNDTYVNAWHGNEVFQVKGHYNTAYQHDLSKVVQEKLHERISLQAKDPDHPMVYTLKIWLNGLYGVIRSALFKNVHTPNAGWDCCWLGQQIHRLTESMMEDFGFESIYGDTDSLMLIANSDVHNNKEYVQECLNKVLAKISENVPFPIETFNIKIENYLPYVLFPFSDQYLVDEEIRKDLKEGNTEGYFHALDEDDKKIIINEENGTVVKKGNKWARVRKGRKKNYMYLYEKDGGLKTEIVGLPIKKDGATPLGLKIFHEVLQPKILEQRSAKFSREYIDNLISGYLENKEIMTLLAREFKIKPYNSYKVSKGKTEPTGIYAQISKGYFNMGDGVISLIKNKKIGKAGIGFKYCTVQEAIENDLTIDDLDLEKIYNELDPFIESVKQKVHVS